MFYFSILSDSSGPGRAPLGLLRVRTPLHPLPLLRPVCFPAAAPYPVGTGKAAILPTIAPKSRGVMWLSATRSQQ